jgi:outer membrane protein
MRSGMNRFVGIFFCGFASLWFLAHPVCATAEEPAMTIQSLDRIEVLDLDTAARIALAENPSLAAAQARVEQAGQIIRQAQAGYWPHVDASAGASRVKLSERNFAPQRVFNEILPPGDRIKNPEDYYQADVTASWLVFDGFARRFQLAAARHGERATTAARDDARRLLLSAVTFAYLQTQLAQENIAIARADEAFNQRLLVEARLRYDVGAGALSDVLNFQVRGNNAQSRRIQEERIYQAGLISLAALLGVSQGRLPDHVRLADLDPTSPSELAAPQIAELVQESLDRRPDLRQSDWSVRQAEAGVKTARAGYYPTIALSGVIRGERPGDIGFEGDDFGNSIGVGLRWNIFSGGLTRARHGEARARLFEIERVRDDHRIRVVAEVQEVVTQIETSQQQLALQETNAQLVRQQRDLVEKEYKAGVGSLVRLNEAQRDLTVAQAQLASARVALRVAWYDLQTSTGRILDSFDGRSSD